MTGFLKIYLLKPDPFGKIDGKSTLNQSFPIMCDFLGNSPISRLKISTLNLLNALCMYKLIDFNCHHLTNMNTTNQTKLDDKQISHFLIGCGKRTRTSQFAT